MDLDPSISPILKVLAAAFVLGMVIFVHELGHFLAARWAGVLVERFSIGFGPVLLSFRRNETEYALSAIPLGGYVKMLGQTDTPDVEIQTDDARSYQNKSVGKRMVIISAGVVMNVIFGFLCFVVAYRIGIPYEPALVGAAIPGHPAWKAGIKPGDEVVAINGRPANDFETLLSEVALTSPGRSVLRLDVARGDQRLEFNVAPIQEPSKPIIGILPAVGTKLSTVPVWDGTPAATAATPGFLPEDTIQSIDGQPVHSYLQIAEILWRKQNQPVVIQVQRQAKEGAPASTADIKTPANYFRSLGIRMQIGEIVAVQDGSPAANAVDAEGKPSPLLPTDVLKAVDGREDIDPIRLQDEIVAKAGKKVRLTVLRPGRAQQQVEVFVTPVEAPSWIDFPSDPHIGREQPMSIPSLGLAYKVLPTIRHVETDSPAATAQEPLKEGDTVSKVEFSSMAIRADKEKGNNNEEKASLTVKEDHWPGIVWALQFPIIRSVTLTVTRPNQPNPIVVTLTPKADPSWPIAMRGMHFDLALADRKVDNIFTAMSLGLEKTRLSIIRLYLFLHSLSIRLTISPKLLGGPLAIAQLTYHLASIKDIAKLVLFMGLLNINLAVINFLPIPILDGGHMVFLAYEAVTRRKLGERVVLVANYIGLFLILSLMVYVIGLDIFRLVER